MKWWFPIFLGLFSLQESVALSNEDAPQCGQEFEIASPFDKTTMDFLDSYSKDDSSLIETISDMKKLLDIYSSKVIGECQTSVEKESVYGLTVHCPEYFIATGGGYECAKNNNLCEQFSVFGMRPSTGRDFVFTVHNRLNDSITVLFYTTCIAKISYNK